MKTKTFVWLCLALFICSACEHETIKPNDPTKFSNVSIIGIWAEVGDIEDYVAGNTTYPVRYYYDIESNSHLSYVNQSSISGEYRVSDGYLHISKDAPWGTLIDATYVFEETEQAIRCTSGKILDYDIASVQDWLGTDTIFYANRIGIDEAEIYDNTGWLRSVHVVRVKGIKEDL